MMPSLRFSSAQLIPAMEALPSLVSLSLDCVQLDGLGFLSCGALGRMLTHLSLSNLFPHMSSAQLLHLHGLKALRSLTLSLVLDAPLCAHSLALFQPPSLLLPSLQHCSLLHAAFVPPANNGEDDGPPDVNWD
jgi:hypothetical protein